MNKNYWNKIFTNWFNLPKDKRILFYNNPNTCNDFKFERVNPNHIGFVWGKRKNRTKNWIKICKITFSQISLFFIDFYKSFIGYIVYLMQNLDVALCCYYILLAIGFYAIITSMPIVESMILCLKR